MCNRASASAALLLVCGLIGSTAFAQSQPNPTQEPTVRQDQVPVFRVTVVGRTTPAVNYRPRRGETKIDFEGTALLPDAKGEAKVEGKKGVMEIDAKFEDLKAPSRFGREYLTYVLWAITPEGRARNLGEIQFDNDDVRMKVTTELQAFGLIVTAEPYFAVSQPSDVVVMENVVRKGGILSDGTEGRVDVINASYDLLKRGSYLMNQDVNRLNVKTIEPGASLDLAEARNAVMLARIAAADRYAPDMFNKASQLLSEAEEKRAKRQSGNSVQMPARQAVQTAEDARLVSLQKQEEEFVAKQRAEAAAREAAALDRARAEEAARKQAEMDKAAEEARRRQAETDIEAARKRAELEQEQLRIQAERDKLAADAARTALERDKEAADAARMALEKDRADAEAARLAAEQARLAAEAQAQQAQQQAQATAAQAEREKAELREKLRLQLNQVLETRETARGLIVNISDVLFDTASATLKPGAREKLARVAGILLSQQGLHLSVEGHTDSVGTEDYNQRLSERRADSVRSYLVGQGIQQGAVATAGLGESMPVATNGTSAGRQQNRRVELVVSGEAIGTTTNQR
jgi:outer membrane protein OmpA-like peptidoglycan-associated protein